MVDYKQYLVWWIGRFPNSKDYATIHAFLRQHEAIQISKNDISDYRIFEGEEVKGTEVPCFHIQVGKRNYGFTVNIHYDIELHSKIEYNSKTLSFLSELYLALKDKYGEVLLIPRQERKFQGLLGGDSKVSDITRIKKYKYKPPRY